MIDSFENQICHTNKPFSPVFHDCRNPNKSFSRYHVKSVCLIRDVQHVMILQLQILNLSLKLLLPFLRLRKENTKKLERPIRHMCQSSCVRLWEQTCLSAFCNAASTSLWLYFRTSMMESAVFTGCFNVWTSKSRTVGSGTTVSTA